MSLTNYETATVGVKEQLEKLVETTAPEYILEILFDIYRLRTSIYDRIAASYLYAGVARLCEELPGHPKQKDFPDTNETIGEKSARLILDKDKEWPASGISHNEIVEIVDGIITDRVCETMIEKWRSKEKTLPPGRGG